MATKPSKKYYYHISTFEGWFKVQQEGLKASEDGYIYMYDTNEPNILAYAAANQLFMTDYGLIRIDPAGITGALEPDIVGELTAKHQFRVKQKLIEKKYIQALGMKKVIMAKVLPYKRGYSSSD